MIYYSWGLVDMLGVKEMWQICKGAYKKVYNEFEQAMIYGLCLMKYQKELDRPIAWEKRNVIIDEIL